MSALPGDAAWTLKPDSSGRVAIMEPEHHHQVLLDGNMASPVLFSPYDVEPWPHIGQQLVWPATISACGGPTEFVTVVRFAKPQAVPNDGTSWYFFSRQIYASRATVETMAGGNVQVGSWVRLLSPHEDSRPNTEEEPPELSLEQAKRLLKRLHLRCVLLLLFIWAVGLAR